MWVLIKNQIYRHSYDQDFFFKAELYTSNNEQLGSGFSPLEKLYDNAQFGTAHLHSLKRLNSSTYEIEIKASDVVPYVWIDLNMTQLALKGVKSKDLMYHFSDNAFYITEPSTVITLIFHNTNLENLTLSDLTFCWIYKC